MASVGPKKKGRWRTLLLLVVLAAGVGGYAARGYLFPKAPPAMMTAVVGYGDVEETVLASGIVKPVKLVAVGAQASGRITAVNVKLGQTVAQGELIAEIDSVNKQNSLRTAAAAVANIRAQIAEKQANLTLAQRTAERQRSVIASNAISRADLESAEADVDVKAAQLEALKAQLVEAEVAVEDARANLAYTELRADADGIITARNADAGEVVAAAVQVGGAGEHQVL